jgi:hypothetical protein
MKIPLLAANDTLTIASRSLPVIGVTLLVAELLAVLGLFRRVQGFLLPLVRFARLPAPAGIALVTALGSSLSADTMIASEHRAGRLNRPLTLLSAQANTLPAYVTETFTYMIPVMLPALGRKPGLFYVAAFLLTGMLKLLLIVTMGRWLAGDDHQNLPLHQAENAPGLTRTILLKAIQRAMRMFVRIGLMLVVATYVTTLALHAGVLSGAVAWMRPALMSGGLPDCLVVPILSYAGSPMAGATAIGTLLKSHAVDTGSATLAALLGSLIALPVFALRYSLARNISIFGPMTGALNTGISVGIGVVSRVGIILLLPLIMD